MPPRACLWILALTCLGGCDLTGDLRYEATPSQGGAAGGGMDPGGMGGSADGGGGSGGSAGDDGWLVRIGGSDDDHLGGIAYDGNTLLIAGDYRDSITLGGTRLNAVDDQSNAFLATMDPADGSVVGTPPNLASPGPERGADILRLADGAIVVAGRYVDGIAIPSHPLPQGSLRAAGWVAVIEDDLVNGRWSQAIEGTAGSGFAGVTQLLEVDGKVVAVGQHDESMETDGLFVSHFSGCAPSMFVATYDAASDAPGLLYSVGGNSPHAPRDAAIVGDQLFVATTQIGPMSCTDADGFNASVIDASAGIFDGDDRLYLLHMTLDAPNVSGEAFAFGSAGDDEMGPIASDGDGVWVSGRMAQDGSCGSDAVPSGAFVCRFDANGTPTFSQGFAGSLAPEAMHVDGGTLYLAGDDPTLIDFGDGPRAGPYVVRFNIGASTLEHIDTLRPDGSVVFSDIVGGGDAVFLAGALVGHLQLGDALLLPEGDDMFVARLAGSM